MKTDDPGYWEMLVKRSLSRFFLLSALSQRPMHGYELRRAVCDCSSSCCEPSDAAVYPALRELVEGGYVECRSEATGARERKVCCLTEKGFRAYRVAAETWSRVMPSLIAAIEQAKQTQTNSRAGRKE